MSEKVTSEGRLYVVATPIGNLEDMTLRAIRVLRECSRIAAEDTRVTHKLMAHFDIKRPVIRHDAHNARESTEGILQLLAAGEDIALVSDAGTPGVSDPGALLVDAARKANFEVFPIPGPSAVTAFVSGAGGLTSHWTFHGFLPKKQEACRQALSALRPGTHIYFTPARDLRVSLERMAIVCPEAQIIVARELTKAHESWYRGKAAALVKDFESEDARKGEAVLGIVIEASAEAVTDSEIAAYLQPLLKEGLRKKAAARVVAQSHGIAVRRAYAVALTMGDKNE